MFNECMITSINLHSLFPFPEEKEIKKAKKIKEGESDTAFFRRKGALFLHISFSAPYNIKGHLFLRIVVLMATEE